MQSESAGNVTPPPSPTFFGDEGRPTFGWLHRPADGTRAALGVVVCNPFGFEEVCAHASLRHFAIGLAEAGLPALRFDYDGLGDSAGDPGDPERVAAWKASIRAAIDFLKRETGVSRVALLGLRLGAALATLVATERDDVAALVLLAPVLRGRAYTRELRLLAASGKSAETPETDSGLLESAGYFLTKEAVIDVDAIDLRKLERRPASEVLVVDRDDVPSVPEPFLAYLRSLETDVQTGTYPGYAKMMDDPQRAVPPTAMIAGVVEWLRARAGVHAPSAASPARSGLRSEVELSVDGTAVRETIVRPREGSTELFGILARPAAASASGLGVVMLNSGSVHHIGPNRLWVTLARSWAAAGATVLRVDVAGIGDSPARSGAAENVVYSSHAVDDARLAIDHLRSVVGRDGRLVAMGLCSGAYHAFKSAVRGLDVDVAVMVDPLTFFWKEGMSLHEGQIHENDQVEMVSRYKRKWQDKETWARLFRGELDLPTITKAVALRARNVSLHVLRDVGRTVGVPLEDDLASELLRVASRGVPMHFVFAAGHTGLLLLRQQGGRTVEKLLASGKLHLDIVDGGDHTFTRLAPRTALVERLDRIVLGDRRPARAMSASRP